MERKVSRRGPHQDHMPLDKSMIGMPTNFSHVGHSYPPWDRFGECEMAEVPGASLKDCLEEARQEVGGRARGSEGEGQGEEQQDEYEVSPPLSPPSPNSCRRNSRRISKDMISLPTNFRHVLHIDPSSADPAQLSLLLKASTHLEYDLEYEAEDDQEDLTWSPQELPKDPQESPKDHPEPPKTSKPHRPSSRVRKSMISLPTNFQHVNHISAGERLHDPDSPPPHLPPEPDLGEEREQKAAWQYHEQATTPPTHSATPYTPTSDLHTLSSPPHAPTPRIPNFPATHHSPIPPPLTLPPTEASHAPAPLSAPPHLNTTSGDGDFDFDIVQFRVPPPPEPSVCDVMRSSHLPQSPTYHQPMKEETEREEEEVAKTWGRDGRGLTWRDRCQEEARRARPLDAPPRPPMVPHASPRSGIGRPTNFQHLRHLDAEAAGRLLLEEECLEERAAWDGERRRGREREKDRERVKEHRTPSLPPALPHVPPPQEPPPQGKLKKAMIGHPTNFQHVAHVGFGGVEGGH